MFVAVRFLTSPQLELCKFYSYIYFMHLWEVYHLLALVLLLVLLLQLSFNGCIVSSSLENVSPRVCGHQGNVRTVTGENGRQPFLLILFKIIFSLLNSWIHNYFEVFSFNILNEVLHFERTAYFQTITLFLQYEHYVQQ